MRVWLTDGERCCPCFICAALREKYGYPEPPTKEEYEAAR